MSDWPSTRQSLLLRLKNPADIAAWQTFVNIYTPLVLHFCRRRGLQEADALDVTQEVLTKISDFEYDAQRSFRGWLSTVTHHEISRNVKKRKRQATGATDEAFLEQQPAKTELGWDAVFDTHILAAALTRVRLEFDTQQWEVFEAVGIRISDTPEGRCLVWSDESPSEVAKRVGHSVAWVYKVKSRIMKRIREEFRYLAEDVPTFTER
jgi:RNA polymerase sigma-70 factor (ECF subfamily)